MRLTQYTDYALRVLMYLGARPDRLCSIGEVAGAFSISRNHLMKVVNDLARAGFVESLRGRAGGIRLGRPAQAINVGVLVRHTEDSFSMADCATCVIAPDCRLKCVLRQAVDAFLAVLDGQTLADLLAGGGLLLRTPEPVDGWPGTPGGR